MKFLKNSLVAIAVYLSLSQVHAVDLDAGDYDYAPSGSNLAILYYQHATRDALYSGSDKVVGNYDLTSDVGIARYVHYTDVAGIHIAPQILIPFGRLDASKDISDLGSSRGLGDIVLANIFFLYHDASTHSTSGITPYLFLPTGEYSSNKALNLGENRYKLNI